MKKKCFYCGIKHKKKNMKYYEVNDYDGYVIHVCKGCEGEQYE